MPAKGPATVRYYDNVVELIGNTPLVRLHNVTEGIAATVLAKVEYFNPDNRFGTEDKGVGVGLKFGKAINQWFDVQVGASYARVRGDEERKRFRVSATLLQPYIALQFSQ